uniref:Ig-like domain-containing protein n=1 Tax=Anolis carolinensis TaxID=28377 RepID=A0A803T8Q8_ANOCA
AGSYFTKMKHFESSSSEIQLTQSDGQTLKPGEILKMTCAVSGYSISSSNWNWIRQPPGKGLEWLGRGYFSSSSWRTQYSSAFSSRISITADASRNEYSLQLSSVTTADSGVYYCARDTVTQRKSIFFTKRGKCDSHRHCGASLCVCFRRQIKFASRYILNS